MGIYEVKCDKCANIYTWFSGGVQQCPFCVEPKREHHMTTDTKREQLNAIEELYSVIFKSKDTNFQWLITELRSAWSRIDKLREALQSYIHKPLNEYIASQGGPPTMRGTKTTIDITIKDTAREALAADDKENDK